MGSVKDLDSTAVYAWTTLISCLICVPAALIFEGPRLKAGLDAAAKVNPQIYQKLFAVGLLYHLYNQVDQLSHESGFYKHATHLEYTCIVCLPSAEEDDIYYLALVMEEYVANNFPACIKQVYHA